MLKGQPELKGKFETEFLPVLNAFGKKTIKSLPKFWESIKAIRVKTEDDYYSNSWE